LKTINHFFTLVHQQEDEESATPIFTLVHDLSTRFWGPTKELLGDDAEILQTPFLNSSFSTIQQKLSQMKTSTQSATNTTWFLVLDKRSTEDETAVIVNVDEGEVRSVRVRFPVASRYLAAASIAHPSIDELMEIAEEEGGGVIDD
jgi:hypothetical protein